MSDARGTETPMRDHIASFQKDLRREDLIRVLVDGPPWSWASNYPADCCRAIADAITVPAAPAPAQDDGMMDCQWCGTRHSSVLGTPCPPRHVPADPQPSASDEWRQARQEEFQNCCDALAAAIAERDNALIQNDHSLAYWRRVAKQAEALAREREIERDGALEAHHLVMMDYRSQYAAVLALRKALDQCVDDFGDDFCVCDETKEDAIDALTSTATLAAEIEERIREEERERCATIADVLPLTPLDVDGAKTCF